MSSVTFVRAVAFLVLATRLARADFQFDQFLPSAANSLDYPAATRILDPHNSLCNQDSRHPNALNAVMPAPGRPIVTYLTDSTAEVTWVYPETVKVGTASYSIAGFYLQISAGDQSDLKYSHHFASNVRSFTHVGLITPVEYHWRVKIRGMEIVSYVSCAALQAEPNSVNSTLLFDPALQTWTWPSLCSHGILQNTTNTTTFHNYTNSSYTNKAMDCSLGCYEVPHTHPSFNSDLSYSFRLIRPEVDSHFSQWISIIWDEAPTGPTNIPEVLTIFYRTAELAWNKPAKMHPQFPVLKYRAFACPTVGDCIEQDVLGVPQYSDYNATTRVWETVALGSSNYFSGYSSTTPVRYINCQELLASSGGNLAWSSNSYSYATRCAAGQLQNQSSSDLHAVYSTPEASKSTDCTQGCYEIFSGHPNFAVEQNYTFTYNRPYNHTTDPPYRQIDDTYLYHTFTGLPPGTTFTFKMAALNAFGWSEYSFLSTTNTTLELIPCPNQCNIPNGVCLDTGVCQCYEGFGPPLNYGSPLCINLPGNPNCENDCSTVLSSISAENFAGRRLMGETSDSSSSPQRFPGAKPRTAFAESHTSNMAQRRTVVSEERFEGPDFRLSNGRMSRADVQEDYFQDDGNWIDHPEGPSSEHTEETVVSRASTAQESSEPHLDVYWSSASSIRIRPNTEMADADNIGTTFGIEYEPTSSEVISSFIALKGGHGTVAGLQDLTPYRFRYEMNRQWSQWIEPKVPIIFAATFETSAISSSSTKVRWSSLPAASFRLYVAEGVEHNVVRVIRSNDQHATVEGLSVLQELLFRVEALDGDICVGASHWHSHRSQLQDFTPEIPGPPVIEMKNETRLSLNWTLTDFRKREIDNVAKAITYTLECRSELSSTFQEQFIGDQHSVELSGDWQTHRWFFRLKASSAAGSSGWSQVTSFKANDFTSMSRPTVAAATGNSVQISWTIPYHTPRGVKTVVKVFDSMLLPIQRRETAGSMLQVDGLDTVGGTYLFAVQSLSSDGTVGALSDFSMHTMPTSRLAGVLPPAPVVSSLHFNTTAVSWKPISQADEKSWPILVVEALDVEHRRALHLDDTHVIIAEQLEGYKYSLSVHLNSALGVSQSSEAITITQGLTTSTNMLFVPSGIQTHLMDTMLDGLERRVRVVWDSPATGHESILCYELEVDSRHPEVGAYRTITRKTKEVVTFPMDPVTISFRVRAIYDDRKSLFTSWSETHFDVPKKCLAKCFEHGDCLPSGLCKCMQDYYGPDCSHTKKHSPSLLAARLHDSGRSFFMLFDRPWFLGDLPGCDGMFDAEFLPYLGASPSCVWTSPTHVTVVLGAHARVSADDMLHVEWANARGSGGETSLRAPNNPVSPQATIIAPYEVSTCDNVVLDAGASTSYGVGRPEYLWAGLGIRPKTTVPQYHLQSREMFSGQSYTYRLRVTDSFGATSRTSLEVFKSKGPVPAITLPGGLFYSCYTDKSLTIHVWAKAASCGGAKELAFLWEVGDELSNLLPADNLHARDLVIPANTLQPGATYTFQLRAFHRDRPSIYSVTPKISVVATAPQLKAEIVGGDRTVSLYEEIVLDATSRSSQPHAIYAWSTKLRSSPVWKTIHENNSTLRVAAGSMRSGSYMFRLTVTYGAQTLVSQVLVHVTDTRILPMQVLNATISTVNPDDPIRLVGISPLLANDSKKFTWTSTFGRLLLPGFNVVPGSVLSLPSGVLMAGSSYKFRFSGNIDGAEAYAEVGLNVRLPPSGGEFRVHPLTGEHLRTKITLSCVGWTADIDDLPLLFKFSFQKGQQQPLLLREPSPQSSFVTAALPPGRGGSLQVQAHVIDSAGGHTQQNQFVEITTAKSDLLVAGLSKSLGQQAQADGDAGQLLMIGGMAASEAYRLGSSAQLQAISMDYMTQSLFKLPSAEWVFPQVVSTLEMLFRVPSRGGVDFAEQALSALLTSYTPSRHPSRVVQDALHVMSNISSILSTSLVTDVVVNRFDDCLKMISQLTFTEQDLNRQQRMMSEKISVTVFRHDLSAANETDQVISDDKEEEIVRIPHEIVMRFRKHDIAASHFDTHVVRQSWNPYSRRSEQQIHSNVTSVVIKSANGSEFGVQNLMKPVLIRFPMVEDPIYKHFVPTCMFWDTGNNLWSEEGCSVHNRSQHSVVCACHHLTNFGIGGYFVNASDPPHLESAAFSKYGASLIVKFDIETEWAGDSWARNVTNANVTSPQIMTNYTEGNCATFFDSLSTALFGQAAKCWRPTRKAIQVQLSHDSTLRPGDNLTIQNNTLKAYRKDSFFSTGSVSVAAFNSSFPKTVVYKAPELPLGLSSALFDATMTIGHLGRPVLYNWTLWVQNNSNWDVEEKTNRRLLAFRNRAQVVAGQWMLTTRDNEGVLELAPQDFDHSDAEYEIELGAINHFGHITQYRIPVVRRNATFPAIFIERQRTDNVFSQHEDLHLKVHAWAPETLDPTGLEMKFYWHLDPLPEATDLFAPWTRDLHISKDTLRSDIEYDITVTAFLVKPNVTSMNASYVTIGAASDRITARFLQEAPQLRIAGGNQTQPSSTPFVLSPIIRSKVELTFSSYNWSCSCNTTACPSIVSTEESLSFANVNNSDFEQNHTYHIELTVSCNSTEQQYILHDIAWLQIVDGVYLWPAEVPFAKVNSDSQVSINITVPRDHTTTWSVLDGEIQKPLGLEESWLILLPGSMRSGGYYNLRLTATNQNGGSGYADIRIRANQAPWSGIMTQRPIAGSPESRFSFNLVGHADDPEDYPLKYSYSYILDTGERVDMNVPSYRSHYTVANLPQGCVRDSNSDEDGCICDPLDNEIMCAGTLTIVGHVEDQHGGKTDVNVFTDVGTGRNRYLLVSQLFSTSSVFSDSNQTQLTKSAHYKRWQDSEGEYQVWTEVASIINLAGRLSLEHKLYQMQVRLELLQRLSKRLRFSGETQYRPAVLLCNGNTTFLDNRCCRNVTHSLIQNISAAWCSDNIPTQPSPIPIYEQRSFAAAQAELLRHLNFSREVFGNATFYNNFSVYLRENYDVLRSNNSLSDPSIAKQTMRAMSYWVSAVDWENTEMNWVSDATREIAHQLLAALDRGGDPVVLGTKNLQVIVAKLPVQSSFQYQVPSIHAFKGLQLGLWLNTTDALDMVFTLQPFHLYTDVTSTKIASDVAQLELTGNGEVVTPEKIEILFPNNRYSLDPTTLRCRYWYQPEYVTRTDLPHWTSDGCEISAHESGVKCSCTNPKGLTFALHLLDGCFACTPYSQCCQGRCTVAGECTCDEGVRGTSCNIACPRVTPSSPICSDRGVCNSEGTCICDPLYAGDACELDCPLGVNDTICSLHGDCVVTGCDCTPAATTSSNRAIIYPIVVYDDTIEDGVMTPGYTNRNCNVSCPVDLYGRYCSGHGACDELGVCKCNYGWEGAECSTLAPTIIDTQGAVCQTCANGTYCCNGVCNPTKVAKRGFGCDCNDGYRGAGCEIACPYVASYLNAYGDGVVDHTMGVANYGVCAGINNGQCDAYGFCSCQSHARGDDCSIQCPRSRLPHTQNLVCSGKGLCDASGSCICQEGFRGRACEIECPRNNVTGITCSGHGACDDLGLCQCAYSYRGEACQLRCPIDDAGAVCFSHGDCDETATCTCVRGYMGAACDLACERCPVSGKLCCFGRCSYTGQCICLRDQATNKSYLGSTCEIPEDIKKPHNSTQHTMASEVIAVKMDSSGQKYGICSDKLRLNGPYSHQVGYAFHKDPQRVLGGFTTKFQMQINDRSQKCRHIRNSFGNTYFYDHCYERGADGFAFVIKGPNVTTTGQEGANLGYGGIENSLAIEFDTWWNDGIEPNTGMAGHISVQTQGNASNSADHKYSLATLAIPELTTSLVKTVIIKYTPGNFTMESVNEDVYDNDRTSVLSPGHLLTTQYNTQFFVSQSGQLGILEVFFEDLEVPVLSVPIDLGHLLDLPDDIGRVGFTSGTATHFQTHDILQWYFCEGRDCEGRSWLADNENNAGSFCSAVACPRGYPWSMYPANVSTTVLGATT